MPDRYSTKSARLEKVYEELRNLLNWLKDIPFEYDSGSKEEEFLEMLEKKLVYTRRYKSHLQNGDIDTHYEIVKIFVNKLSDKFSQRFYMTTKDLINGTTPWNRAAIAWRGDRNITANGGGELVLL